MIMLFPVRVKQQTSYLYDQVVDLLDKFDQLQTKLNIGAFVGLMLGLFARYEFKSDMKAMRRDADKKALSKQQQDDVKELLRKQEESAKEVQRVEEEEAKTLKSNVMFVITTFVALVPSIPSIIEFLNSLKN